MSEVAVQKVHEGELPILDDLEKRFETIQRRAFDLFEERGREGAMTWRTGSRRSTSSGAPPPDSARRMARTKSRSRYPVSSRRKWK